MTVQLTESRSLESTDSSLSESGEPASSWTRADLERIADKVYELLMKDLMLERERGLR